MISQLSQHSYDAEGRFYQEAQTIMCTSVFWNQNFSSEMFSVTLNRMKICDREHKSHLR